ncbi:MAG: tetratricopeptide repeat protein, partial [Bacteroidota bacterium]
TGKVKQQIQMLEDKAKGYYYSAPDTAYLYLDSALQLADDIVDTPLLFDMIKEKGFLFSRKGGYDSALFYYNIANDYLNKDVSDGDYYMLKNLQSEALYYHGNIDSALYLMKEVLDYAQKYQDTALLLRSYGNGLMFENTKGNYIKAIEYGQKALNYTKTITEEVITYMRIASVYIEIKQYDKAIKLLREAYILTQKDEGRNLSTMIYNNIGRAFEGNEAYDSALYYYKKSYSLNKENDLQHRVPVSLINIGNIYLEYKEYDKALEYYNKAYNHPNIHNQTKALTATTVNIGAIYSLTNRPDSATYYLEKGFQLADKYDYVQFKLIALKRIADNEANKENYLEALALKDSAMHLNDSIWDDELNERVAALQAEANIDQKIRENDLLRKRDQENQRKLFYQQVSLALLGLGILSVIIMLIVIYRNREKLKAMNASLSDKNKEISQKNKQLEELNKTKDKFFSIISHDLKGPIGTLIALLQELDDDYDDFDEEDRKEIIRNLRASGQNTYNLLLNLLDWARSQREMVQNNPQKLDMFDLVEEVLGVLESRAKQKNIHLRNYIPQNQLYAWADPEMSRTILINIINNAIKFSYENSSVDLNGLIDGEFVHVLVNDHGIGIPENFSSELFKLNNEAQRSGTADERGTGLGLILSHEFAHKMGGDIRVDSIEGKGTTFEISLPVFTDDKQQD